jgi:hypothetical protein
MTMRSATSPSLRDFLALELLCGINHPAIASVPDQL